MTSVKASLDIYRVNSKCEGIYQGTVALDKEKLQVGLPSDETTYLVFRFNSSGFLSSSSGVISNETLLKARKGHRYTADVRYIDGIYNVEIFEQFPRQGKPMEVPFRHISDCQR